MSFFTSYSTRDLILGVSLISKNSTGRFELEYTEFTRESKTRSVNGGSEAGANNEESVAARAEAAAHAAEAALSAAHRERAAAEAAVAAVEIMQRTARDTAQKFADSATQAARPQLKMMEEQNQHLRTAVEGMNILSSQNALMVTKITPFTGNPRDYRRFIANFTHNVANKCTDDSIRLNYLIEHCQGDAKSLIEDCVLLENGGYKTAKDLLETEYGQKTDIAADYLSFLKSGEEIKGTDVDGLTKLSQEMAKCSVTLKEIKYEHDLHAQTTLNSIVDRLPSYMRSKWVDKANEYRKKDVIPSFDTLREFISDRARALRSSHGKHYIESLSSNSAKNVKSTQQSKPSVKKEKHSTTTLATQSATTAPVTHTGGITQQAGKKKECAKCKKDDHHISTCESFSKASLTERTNFVRDNKLCFNCLNPGHQIVYCRNSKRCATCKKKHHILLHDDNYQKRESPATTTETQSAQVSCMLRAPGVFLRTLPVRICCNDREITGVALLDGGAQTSLATSDVFNKLKVKCPPSILRITTVTGQVRKYNSLSADITIKSLDGVNSVKMEKVHSIT